MKFRKVLFAATLLLSLSTLKAQDHEVGAFLGFSVYNGDLAQSPIPIRGTRPAIGALYKYNFNPNVALRTGINFGYIASYDRYSGKGTNRENRRLSFYSPLLEANLMVEVNLRKFISGSRRYKAAPYVFGGISLFHFSPHTWDSTGSRVALHDLETEPGKKYSLTQLAIPLGIGYKWNIGKKKLWNASFEIGYRKTFTDYLDDVSGSVNPAATGQAAELTYRGVPNKWPAKWRRGNPNKDDSYFFYGFTITKTIRKFSCRF